MPPQRHVSSEKTDQMILSIRSMRRDELKTNYFYHFRWERAHAHQLSHKVQFLWIRRSPKMFANTLWMIGRRRNIFERWSIVSFTDAFDPIVPKSECSEEKMSTKMNEPIDIRTQIWFCQFVTIVWVSIHSMNHLERRRIPHHRWIVRSMDWWRWERDRPFSIGYEEWLLIDPQHPMREMARAWSNAFLPWLTSYFLSPETRDKSLISTCTVPTSDVAESEVQLNRLAGSKDRSRAIRSYR